MSLKKSSFLLVLAILYLSFDVSISQAATGAPRILNYQGRLMDSSGTVLGGAGTEYCFRFSLYDNPTVGSGTKLWPVATPSVMTVSVKNGVFNAGVGDTNANGDVLDYNFQDSDTIYLNVDVATKVGSTCAPGDGAESYESLSPRQRLFSSAYTVNANTVGGFSPSQNAQGNQIPVLSSGNLILGGANPTLSASTSNMLTIQGSGTGNIQFFNASNRMNSSGTMTLGGSLFLANSFATSSLQSSTTGTSSIQGFLQVLGSNSTSTFSSGLSTASFAVTGGATSTFSNGVNVSSGCFSVGGTCLNLNPAFSTSSADFYVNASSTIPKTYTANSFTATQTFINASTTNISAIYASSTQGFFGSLFVGGLTGVLRATAGAISASLVNLAADVTGVLTVANGGTGWAQVSAGTLLTGNGAGVLATTTVGNSLQLSGGTLSLNISNANLWTGLQSFGNASTSLQSVFTKAYFGGTATTTIDSNGNVAVAGTLTVTGNTTLANATTTNLLVTASSSILNLNGVNSTTTNATTTNFFATTALAGTITSSGAVNFSSTLAVTGLTTLGSASSTLLSVANGAATTTLQAQATSTFGAGVQTSALTIGSLSGFLKGLNGFVTTSLVSLTSDISGILTVANGGTGWANLASSTFLTGTGSGSVATTTIASSLQISGSALGLNVANPNVWSGLQTFANASSTLLESMSQFARTIQSTSTNALVFKTNFTSSAGLTLGSTSTPQMAALDTLNNRVTIGTGGGSPTLFVVDTKNTLGDPAGVDGAQYYNSNSAQYRCYASGSWRTCGGQAASSTGDVQFKNSDGSFTATSNFNWNLASNGLTITGNPGQVGDLLVVASSSGAIMFDITSGGILELATTSDPVRPTNGLNIYAKSISGRPMIKWKDSFGLDSPIQPALFSNNTVIWTPAAAVGIWQGTQAAPALGTNAVVLPSTTNLYTAERRSTWASVVTTLNQQVGMRNSENMFWRGSVAGQGGFFAVFHIGTSVWTAGDRLFVGFSTGTTAVCTGNPSALANILGFDIDAGDTAITFLHSTGAASGVKDAIAGQPTLASNQGYDMYMFAAPNSSSVSWRIDDVNAGATIAEGIATTTLPTNTTLMAAHVCMSNGANTPIGSATLGVNRVYIETNR